ncbi:tryptophan halogenase [Alteromonadaceae bacterium Bs31]|nr:tryptophan halogenase [Alteromonadaceae bacterium Bs31]
MSDYKLNVVVAGGGTSGWMAAAAISKLLSDKVNVTLIESDEIGRIGVGEATIPPLREFNRLLGIDEQDFMSSINATFKLGIEFNNWGRKDDSYIHSFGVTGRDCWACDFHNFWLKGKNEGIVEDFGQYCVELQAARHKRILGSDQHGVNYAYHLDAGLYAQYLKELALKNNTRRLEGKIVSVNLCEKSCNIKSLSLDDGMLVEGDLFLDCTGFKALLIEGALNVQYEPYGQYLPCDSAIAIQSEISGEPRPYTQAIAHDAGWQWRIPLQTRVGNGLVYCSRHLSDENAEQLLLKNLESRPITESRMFRYKTGRRIEAWKNNCIAIGLASGFLEPVESTSIHIAMSSILRLLRLFPVDKTFSNTLVAEFNQQTKTEMEQIRDFIIMHYNVTERDDSEFWRYCKNMSIPETLKHRLELFQQTAAFPIMEKELFKIDSWIQVMMGQRLVPESYHPIVDLLSKKELEGFFYSILTKVRSSVENMPGHQDFINQYCKSKEAEGLPK